MLTEWLGGSRNVLARPNRAQARRVDRQARDQDTRISVEFVLECLGNGWTMEELVIEGYPE